MKRADWVPCVNYGSTLGVAVDPNQSEFVHVVLVQPQDVLGGEAEVGTMDASADVTVHRTVGGVAWEVREQGDGVILIHERIRKGLLDNVNSAAFYAEAFFNFGLIANADADANEPFVWERQWILYPPLDSNAGSSSNAWSYLVDTDVKRGLERGEALFYSAQVGWRQDEQTVPIQLIVRPWLRSWVVER